MSKAVTSQELQMKTNKHLAKNLNTDAKTAFLIASQVKRRLTVPVNEKLFTSLVSLCYKMGINNFSNSLVLKMVNSKASQVSLNRVFKMTLDNQI